MQQLPLKEYESAIHLRYKYAPSLHYIDSKVKVVDELVEFFLRERDYDGSTAALGDHARKRHLLKGLLNKREPSPLGQDVLDRIDSLLQCELMEKEVVRVDRLSPVTSLFPQSPYNQSERLVLWQGDITRLNTDAIVNAANKYMLGCFQPMHACIDNAIHSAAGPRLREDCNTIMSIQKETEFTGGAKITRGYNLPSSYVLHTVGPIVLQGTVLTPLQREELASCYISCLELAHELPEIKSVAFCAISTGVFGFPKPEAAFIAVNTVNDWLNANPKHHFEKILFNVFSEADYHEYAKVFTERKK
ncbi:protein-ADP-ribose hydrolase [Paenibacillus macerans]|uniref:protein-ADP-ribose hydrolase n=1 Tax=Paenibacillus macerans TaxID=44252 RepID=UPI003D31D12F